MFGFYGTFADKFIGTMKHLIDLETPAPQGFAFLYMAFAHLTDAKLTTSEETEIWNCVKRWAEKDVTRVEFSKIMDDTIKKYKLAVLKNNVLDEVIRIARKVGGQQWFNRSKRLASLRDLRKIAMADNRFIEEERDWIVSIAKIWDIDELSIKRLLKDML